MFIVQFVNFDFPTFVSNEVYTKFLGHVKHWRSTSNRATNSDPKGRGPCGQSSKNQRHDDLHRGYGYHFHSFIF